MKFTLKNTKGMKVKIFDNLGRELPKVFMFDTKTHKIAFYVTDKNGNVMSEAYARGKKYRAKTVRTIWHGAYAVVEGVRI